MQKKNINKKRVVATVSKVAICQSKSRFWVYDDNGKFGELQLTQGSITWLPRDAKRGRSMYWEDFDKAAACFISQNQSGKLWIEPL